MDFRHGAGDHGDGDLRAALAALDGAAVSVPLCTFGHMHGTLRGGGHRRMVAVDADTGTVFLNAAVVRRPENGF